GRRSSRALWALSRAAMEALESRRLLSIDVLSYHGSSLDSNGVNSNETQLTPSSVTVSSFGKQFTTDVRDTPYLAGIPASTLPSGYDYVSPSGQVYAEPLVKTGVNITTGANQGLHDVVFVATQMDSLFAIDANGGTILWKDSFLYNPTGNPNPLNANIPLGVTACPGAFGTETNSQDITPWIGITSTPVIDAVNGYIYVSAKTREAQGDENNPHYVYTLHKVRLSDGFDTSTVMGDTTFHVSLNTFTYNSGPYVVGDGNGSGEYVTVNGQHRIYFNAMRQHNRPALMLYDNHVYISFASHGDQGNYHGWVLGYDTNTLANTAAFNTSPNGWGNGIWQGGGTTVIDPSGPIQPDGQPAPYFYFETGNGTFDGFNGANGSAHTSPVTGLDGPGGSTGFPSKGNYGDSFLKITLDPTTTQGNQGTNKNGFGLKVVDYFSPYNNLDLDSADRDLGSGAPILLPDSAGSAAHKHLLVGSGKEGKLYLIDRDNMGKFGNTDNVVQTVGGAINGSLDTPAFFNGRLYYTSGYGGTGKSWQVSSAQITTATGVQNTPDSFAFPGASPYISSNGTVNGVAWMIDKGTGQLRAYDAGNIATELWNSSQNAARDALGSAVKFTVATPVNGRVYVGTAGFLVVYGPPVPPTMPPAAPTMLTAAATGASTIFLSWQDNSNNEDGFKIERSSDEITFNVVGTAGVNQTTYTDSGLSSQAKYYYQVRAFNSFNTISYSNYTNIANATTTSIGTQLPVDLYHFDEGSGTSTIDSVGNNNGTLVGSPLPAWVTPGRVGSANLSFSGNNANYSNGLSAVNVQNNLAPILGSTSSLTAWIKTTEVGLSDGSTWQDPAITGVEQNGGGNDIRWGFLDTTGHIGIAPGDGATARSANPINDGQWHHVAFTRDAVTGIIKVYVDGVLSATATGDTGNKTSQFFTIGANTNVASDGITRNGAVYFNGQLDDVRIYNQVLDPAEISALALPPAAPTNLVVTPASGTELDLVWADNATTETGYKLERSVNGGPFIQLPQLPANTTSYMDTGLTQGTPYAYRVRATNTAGDSAYSNTVNTATPVPPLTPTGAMTTLISQTEIDLKWTDNANNEQGYKVLRRIGADNFAQIADLPPNTTTYNDTNHGTGLTPNTTYDYHIQAYNIAGYSDFTGITVTTYPIAPAYVSTIIDDGNRQRSVVRSLTFKFSSAVTLSAGAITLARMNTAGSNSGSNDGAPPTDASSALDFVNASTPDGGLTWIIPFVKSVAGFTDSSGSLVDNVYAATVHASLVTDAFGQTLTGGDRVKNFHRLYGDVNGDGKVSNADFTFFSNTFGLTGGQSGYNRYFDFVGPTVTSPLGSKISNADFTQFSNRFGKQFNYTAN
ncbi:MAG: coagulation factor 5/8 type domain protein, partial [Phycisphaerales bacterium]|nr:coagulation factor 5/8 type domain protein [Phycisphaerales bacterium]